MTSLIGCGDVAIKQRQQVYLLPIFYKNMIRALNLKQTKLLAKALSVIGEDFSNSRDRLREIERRIKVVERETKGHAPVRNQIKKVLALSKKTSTPDGVRQLTVLNEIEALIETLEKYPEMGRASKDSLHEIIEMNELFDSFYNSGMEDRTFNRMLSLKEEPVKDIDRKTEIIIETFVKELKDIKIQQFFFQECLSSDKSIESIFFFYNKYRVKCYDTMQEGHIISGLIKLKTSDETEWYSILYDIVRSLVLKPYGFLVDQFSVQMGTNDPIEQIPGFVGHDIKGVSPNSEVEHSVFMAFHDKATTYISRMCLTTLVSPKEQISSQKMLTAVSDVWDILVRLHKENKINLQNEIDTEFAHELILHSLHNQAAIHNNLRTAFRTLCGGKS